ncbi:MAG: NAD(P)-dependent oxidoreductase [Leptolyngbyaceae cyanobacterium bins.59]|nr:NAD(P)-dependent oxidoreductase [Leptolyngbyaceae cyanobacterium bins.59]
MTTKRILLTGASGCIGHYIAETLIQNTDYDLYLLVRNPAKIQFDYTVRPGITVLQGDMQDIEQFADLLQTIQCAILTAAAWGDPKVTFDINVVKTIRLMNLLDPAVCEQVIYFSTASILGRDNQPLKEAGEIGTDYVRSKYDCHQKLAKLAIAPKITTVFPTLVLGGDENKPYSHISGGITDVTKWAGLMRFLKVDGSFHFIHAQDIAQVVAYLVDHLPEPSDAVNGLAREWVLGNPKMTADEAIEELCDYLNLRIYFRIPLSIALANVIIKVFRLQMAAWDRFSLDYRHFTHQNPMNPSKLGLTSYCPTLSDVLRLSGVPQGRK